MRQLSLAGAIPSKHLPLQIREGSSDGLKQKDARISFSFIFGEVIVLVVSKRLLFLGWVCGHLCWVIDNGCHGSNSNSATNVSFADADANMTMPRNYGKTPVACESACVYRAPKTRNANTLCKRGGQSGPRPLRQQFTWCKL